LSVSSLTAQRIIEDLSDDRLAVWQHRPSAKWHRADGTQTDRTILEKRLDDYTKKNTFDYFIHKDLGGFLRRELDFYCQAQKNAVLQILQIYGPRQRTDLLDICPDWLNVYPPL